MVDALMKQMSSPDWDRRRRGGEIVQVEHPLLPVPLQPLCGRTRVSWIDALHLDIDGRS